MRGDCYGIIYLRDKKGCLRKDIQGNIIFVATTSGRMVVCFASANWVGWLKDGLGGLGTLKGNWSDYIGGMLVCCWRGGRKQARRLFVDYCCNNYFCNRKWGK